MTDIRAKLEQLIEAAIDDGSVEIAAAAIDALDNIDGDPDLEADQFDEPELPPLVDGGWGYGLGRLPVYDQCPCCGHRELAGWASPVSTHWEGQPTAVL